MPCRCRDCRGHFIVRTRGPSWRLCSCRFAGGLSPSVFARGPWRARRPWRGIEFATPPRFENRAIILRGLWSIAFGKRLESDRGMCSGLVEIDETCIGGKGSNMSLARRRELKKSRVGSGTGGKAIVAGADDRTTGKVCARVVENTGKPALQGFVMDKAEPGATLCTGGHRSCTGMPEFNHEAVNHSVSGYVRGMARTNGMESFWSMFRRGYTGTFHHFSARHLQRYVNEFAARQGMRSQDTEAIMGRIAARMVGRRFTCARLTS